MNPRLFPVALCVLALTLTRANGVLVEALPLSTRVDFAQYTEMTEFLTTASIPSGLYTQATITLDYQNADIWVEDEAGAVVPVETIRDEQGSAITTLEVSVQLENRNALLILPGIPAHLTLDFDLQASNFVTFDSSGDPELTVKPVLLAEINPETPKIHRVRGPLKTVNVDDMSFKVIVRPFYHRLTVDRRHEQFGALPPDKTLDEGLKAKLAYLPPFAAHLAAIAKRLEEDNKTGEQRYVYVRSAADHFSMAFTCDVVAWEHEAWARHPWIA